MIKYNGFLALAPHRLVDKFISDIIECPSVILTEAKIDRASPSDVFINLWCQSDVLTKQEVGHKETTGDIKFQS